jgi:hypothetical protein
MRDDGGDNSFAIVGDAEAKVSRVRKVYFEASSFGVLTSIPDGFVADPIDFVADDRVHLRRLSLRNKNRIRKALDPALIQSSSKRLGEVIRLGRRRAQRVQRCPPFFRSLSQPNRQPLHRLTHAWKIRGLIESIIRNHLATLNRLHERVMNLAG